MTQLWTITSIADGSVLADTFATDSSGVHPKDRGWAWNSATQKAWQISSAPDRTIQNWTGTAWADDPAKVEALLVAQVKSANEALVKAVYSQNYGKQKKYSRKQQESLDFRALSGALGPVTNALTAALTLFIPGFNALTAAQQKTKFRFAMAQAALRGTTIDVIIGEFEAAISTVEAKVANWEAVELEAVRAIKLATTAAGKRAAYAAINWNWTAS